jgi:anti-sigma regulatory factor (Ser/Thr protein kinase)
MGRHQQVAIAIADSSSVGQARRLSALMAERAGLRENDRGRVTLIVTELATNLLAHARGGEILVRILCGSANPGVEVIALDRGPGIADLNRCMSDGYSSRGGRGCGLGAVRRLSTDFSVFSIQPSGTAIASRVRAVNAPAHAEPDYSVICLPAPGETQCGDAWELRLEQNKLRLMVADGLGHGPLAATAAARAVQTFDEGGFDSPTSYLEAAHGALRSSRGAAVAMAEVALGERRLRYAGVGNIAASVVDRDGRSRGLLSHNGIVGLQVPNLKQLEYVWDDGDLLVMHSDGLNSRWKFDAYPGLARAGTAIIAGVLYRDSKRQRDDATVLVARLEASIGHG